MDMRGTVGLYIRDDGVRALAARLAEQRRCTLTEAVREALEEQLGRIEDDRAQRLRRTREIIDSMRQLPDLRPGFTDKDLYDDEGNPIL
jgi:hypothetical protein